MKNVKLEIVIPEGQKVMIERAFELSGYESINEYLVAALVDKSFEVIHKTNISIAKGDRIPKVKFDKGIQVDTLITNYVAVEKHNSCECDNCSCSNKN